VIVRVHLWFRSRSTYLARRFIRNNAQTVAAFTAETMSQPPRFFVRKAAGFAAALADHRPSFKF